MSHFEDIERPLYASELFKSFKLNIITNHRSNFLSSEKLDECVSFEGSLFYEDDYDGNRPGFNVNFKVIHFDFSEGELSGFLTDVFKERFESKYIEDDTRDPSPFMKFELKRRKKVNDEEPDYFGMLVDEMPGFKAVTYKMDCWICHDEEKGGKCLEGTLTYLRDEPEWDGCIYPPEIY